MTSDETVIRRAFEIGINFFFVSADLHWPLYEPAMRGLEGLLKSPAVNRDDIVVAVVSYLEQPLFRYLQFHEVLAAVPGLERVDVLVAGAVGDLASLNARLPAIAAARQEGVHGAAAIGASFHDRSTALSSLNSNCMDIHFIRYNSGHPGARYEIFPFLREDRRSLIFNFKSLLLPVTEQRFRALGLGTDHWLPEPTDYYRFALSTPYLDGVLCSPMTVGELDGMVKSLSAGTLSEDEQEYMMWLSAIGTPQLFETTGGMLGSAG
jgi:hypothetical protein